MEIKNRKIKDLIPYENNPKKHPESQLDLIIKSFEVAGFINPVVIDSDDVIVCGHGRVLAAKKKGLKEVPCVQLDVDKVTADQIRLLENKTLESDYDLEKLSQELARFSDDLSMTGFDQQEYDDLIRKLEGRIDDYDFNYETQSPTPQEKITIEPVQDTSPKEKDTETLPLESNTCPNCGFPITHNP